MIESFTDEHWFLSNFSEGPVPIVFEGHEYRTVEHAYQAAKTRNPQQRAQIRNARTPALAKKLGRKANLRDDWEEVKVEIMRNLVIQKFEHPVLAEGLRATGNQLLIEGNWWGDDFWGAVSDSRHNVTRTKGRLDGYLLANGRYLRGRNELGKLLMAVRETLR